MVISNMADLSFIYGTMESGKTTKLLQDNFNYHKHGHNVVIIKPLLDTKGGNTVVSRMNESAKVHILLGADASILDLENLKIIKNAKVVLIDEAQFFSEKQIFEFWQIAHILNICVICYGLKSDFQGRLFEGSSALIGLADKKTELTVNCRCGETAVFNARKINGKFVYDGDVVAIDGEKSVTYEPLCSKCFLENVIDKKIIENVLERKRKCR